MTREAFIDILDEKRYSYRIEGNKIVVTHEFAVHLDSLTSLPSGVAFKNGGYVWLDSLTSLPPGTVFKNEESVSFNSLYSLPPGVVFENRGSVYLYRVTSLSPGVVFRNGGGVHLGWEPIDWEGNIEGIDSKRLLNKMISLGLFEKRR
jgi:hypothetical protein